MNSLGQHKNSALISLLILLGLTLGFTLGVQLLVLLVELAIHGKESILFHGNFELDFRANPLFSYTMIVSSSVGTFLLPALVLQRLEPYYVYFPKKKDINGGLFFIVLLFMLSFAPALQWISEINQSMSLPESLKSLEGWMRVQEDKMAVLTERMVMTDDWRFLLVNLFAVAVVPALVEEYYFRGSLMHIVQRMVKNQHVTIWLTAIIFSAIHVQFFGFIPRVLLGAFFGYMFVWTQNIWIPIWGHFINNGSAVVVSFYYSCQGKTFQELQANGNYSIFVYIGSVIVSGIIAWFFYYKTKQINSIDGKRMD